MKQKATCAAACPGPMPARRSPASSLVSIGAHKAVAFDDDAAVVLEQVRVREEQARQKRCSCEKNWRKDGRQET